MYFLLFLCACLAGTSLYSSPEAQVTLEAAARAEEEAPNPIQKQYEEVLIAFRKTIGQKGSPAPQKKRNKQKEDPKKISFGTLELPAQTQMEMALELMARLDSPKYEGKDRALFAPDTWQSLRLIGQEPSAVSGIAPEIKTIFGKLFLARLLTTPTINLDRIHARQDAIKELCKDDKKTNKIVKLCGEIKQMQEHILGLTNSEHPLYQKGLRIYLHDFFLRPISSENRGWNIFSKLFGDIWYAAGPVTAGLLIRGIWKKYASQTRGEWTREKVFTPKKRTQEERTTALIPLQQAAAPLEEKINAYEKGRDEEHKALRKSARKNLFAAKPSGDQTRLQSFRQLFKKKAEYENPLSETDQATLAGLEKQIAPLRLEKQFNMDYRSIAAVLIAITAYNGAVQIPGVITWMRNRFRAANYFYDQLRPLRKFFKATAQLKKLLEETPALAALSEEIDADLLLADKDVQKLHRIIMGTAFKNRFAGHAIGGDIVLAVDLLSKCREKVLKGIGLLGALDTYSSLALWYNQLHDSKTNPLCFAQLSADESPSLTATQFWHVLARANPYLNDIQLGASQPQNAIITGIFESGKSTILQSIALNVVCAQSIGICLAKTFKATPYASINIYANIKDDLANNRSLFKTELFRALQLLDQIKQMPKGYFSFTIADATFTGTEAGAGQAAAYAVARYLGKLKNSVALHATNFISLSVLGTQEPEIFANYSLPTRLNGEAKESSYVLTKGFLNPQHATAIFREEKLPLGMIAEMEKQIALSLR